jgi:hypothetical protein
VRVVCTTVVEGKRGIVANGVNEVFVEFVLLPDPEADVVFLVSPISPSQTI